MSHRLCVVGLVALCLISRAGGEIITGDEVQNFINGLTTKVWQSRDTSAWELYAQFQDIELNLNNLAGTWYEIDVWGDQTSRWILLKQTANNVVQKILDLLPSLTETPDPPIEAGSKNPLADMKSVAVAICEEISSLQTYAKETFDVVVTLTSMSACAAAAPEIGAFSVDDPVSALSIGSSPEASASPEAAAPAPSRRLLSA